MTNLAGEGSSPAPGRAPEAGTGRGEAPAGSLASLGRRWLVTIFAGSAAYAGLVAVTSGLGVHRSWALFALGGYMLAAVAACWPRRGADLALLMSLAGALLAPLGWLAASGTAQREIYVIARSAWMLLHHGTPYRSVAALADATNPDAYNPYMPAMSLFGIGNQTLHGGPPADPRIWFTVAFAVVFTLALRIAGAADVPRWAALVTASPLIAFPLAVGGDDVPVIGLLCLGLALLTGARHPPRAGWAGLAFGVAAALKATAWPAAGIAAVLLATRDGRRSLGVFAAAAAAAFLVLVAPAVIIAPAAMVDNTIMFPLGLTEATSGAASPLPGFLLASTGHTGKLAAAGLLAAVVVGVAVWLLLRPPASVPGATWRIIVTLVLLFLLAPSTRVGYFTYPLTLWAWLGVSRLGARNAGYG
ncbi:MAG TPA: glycosyltransferase 87 family protein [Streptosporangiaceae bacterium]|jgi:hypothetical protein